MSCVCAGLMLVTFRCLHFGFSLSSLVAGVPCQDDCFPTWLPTVAFGRFLSLFSWMPLRSGHPYVFHCFIWSWSGGCRVVSTSLVPVTCSSQSGETPSCSQAGWETLQHVLGLPLGLHPMGHAWNISPVQKTSKIKGRATSAGFCGSRSSCVTKLLPRSPTVCAATLWVSPFDCLYT